jgi:hypothetical protein
VRSLIEKLQLNEMVCDALFEYDIPADYELKIPEEEDKKKDKEPRKPRKELLEEGAPAPDFTLNDGEGER